MKKLKVIKLKIVSCANKEMWYFKKIGKEFYFFDEIFIDFEGYTSLYLAVVPTDNYVYIKDTNYNSYQRKKKINKLNKIKNDNTI